MSHESIYDYLWVPEFLTMLHALHYPERHVASVAMHPTRRANIQPDETIDMPTVEAVIIDPNTSATQCARAIHQRFKSFGRVVVERYPNQDYYPIMLRLAHEALDAFGYPELDPMTIEEVLPPADVVQAMFEKWSQPQMQPCGPAEDYIKSLKH